MKKSTFLLFLGLFCSGYMIAAEDVYEPKKVVIDWPDKSEELEVFAPDPVHGALGKIKNALYEGAIDGVVPDVDEHLEIYGYEGLDMPELGFFLKNSYGELSHKVQGVFSSIGAFKNYKSKMDQSFDEYVDRIKSDRRSFSVAKTGLEKIYDSAKSENSKIFKMFASLKKKLEESKESSLKNEISKVLIQETGTIALWIDVELRNRRDEYDREGISFFTSTWNFLRGRGKFVGLSHLRIKTDVEEMKYEILETVGKILAELNPGDFREAWNKLQEREVAAEK